MRILKAAPGEHYHICNRGVEKKIIFHNDADYFRFLFLILYFQSNTKFPQVGRSIKEFVKHRVLDNMEDIVKKRIVELVVFCIMPNHFHLILRELEEGAISSYMQRVLNAYGKYYNTKYQKNGHVFQGPYRLIHVSGNSQMLHLGAYIHRNPREIKEWFGTEDEYPWSSYQDYIGENRWGNLLVQDIFLSQFKDKDTYRNFVETSPAKLLEEEFDYLSEWSTPSVSH